MMYTKRLGSGLALGIAILLSTGAMAADAILPTPEQLVTMSIQQRLTLFQSMENLPPNQRDANLKALRDEITALSPTQKLEMSDRFRSEFNAMPIDQQEAVREKLQVMQQTGDK